MKSKDLVVAVGLCFVMAFGVTYLSYYPPWGDPDDDVSRAITHAKLCAELGKEPSGSHWCIDPDTRVMYWPRWKDKN